MPNLSAIFYSDFNLFVTSSDVCMNVNPSELGFDTTIDKGELAESLSIWARGQKIIAQGEYLAVI
ncbi:hypothetical protein [Shewanella sp. SM87]|jgi:hypothetical protein|uniref:hypothetical protein n=1 Tax=Shewanella TaxID=22 RepID=UPI0021D913A5|nr:hypothetical protein [Shewanella sp. SM87]MCU8010209.1 hypothetical protein [Shewanella sp. SM87]